MPVGWANKIIVILLSATSLRGRNAPAPSMRHQRARPRNPRGRGGSWGAHSIGAPPPGLSGSGTFRRLRAGRAALGQTLFDGQTAAILGLLPRVSDGSLVYTA